MAEQYWIGDFFIDLSRNQITQSKQSQVIAPKALAVLTYLAENQGKVVSHDALLDAVWQETVVSPNTLQRSIAQLRKALGDDGKAYIKTHAKQGYSLECDVRWHNEGTVELLSPTSTVEPSAECNAETQNAHAKKQFKPLLKIAAVLVVFIIISVIGVNLNAPEDVQLSIDEFRLLTSTDNQEFASIYSPDGQYVVFHRYSEEFCVNNIWAKNTATQKEYQITQNLDSYGRHSFSPDGEQLVFIQQGDCEAPITQKKCYTLVALAFNKALEAPQVPNELMECINSEISSPIWLNNNDIAMLQKATDQSKLIRYSIEENRSDLIYMIDDGNIIDYDYSLDENLIAVIAVHSDGLNYIDILKPDGQLISSSKIHYPEEIANHRYIYPNFSPFEDLLVFSTGRQLFTLSYDGQVSKISLPLDTPMTSPIFHPAGNRLLVVKGHYDSDIISVPLAQISGVQTVLERSTVGDDSAILQPYSDLMAYRSERSGEQQIWLTDGNNTRQLSQFPMDTFVDGFDWAADGTSLLVNANKQLNQIFLDGSVRPLTLEYPIHRLLQWDSQNKTALLMIRINGISKLGELDLTTSQLSVLTDKRINWALKSADGRLIYTDHMDRFWQPGPAEDQRIEALDTHGSDKRFLIRDDIVYGINEDLQFWSYDLNSELFKILGNAPSNIDYLTDIDQTDLLMTVRVSGRKEVAELLLNE